jgi:hypothetical protein
MLANSKAALEKAKLEIPDINKKKLFVPYMRVDRFDWSPDSHGAAPAEGASAAEKEKAAKRKATAPAYKVTVFGAVTMQATPEESQALLRKLLVEPMKKKLKETDEAGNPKYTIDSEVVDSQNYVTNMPQLFYNPQRATTGPGGEPAGPRSGPRKDFDENANQEAGPFFGTEVTWTLRLREAREEPVEEKAEEEPKTGKKPGGKKPVKK